MTFILLTAGLGVLMAVPGWDKETKWDSKGGELGMVVMGSLLLVVALPSYEWWGESVFWRGLLACLGWMLMTGFGPGSCRTGSRRWPDATASWLWPSRSSSPAGCRYEKTCGWPASRRSSPSSSGSKRRRRP